MFAEIIKKLAKKNGLEWFHYITAYKDHVFIIADKNVSSAIWESLHDDYQMKTIAISPRDFIIKNCRESIGKKVF